MNTLQFILGIVQAIAWPVTVLTVITLLRRPIARSLLTLTKLKYKDLELDFGRELKQIEESAKTAQVLPAPRPETVGGPKGAAELLLEADQLADDFPEPAVAVAWSAVEVDLMEATERITNSDGYRRKSSASHIKLLVEKNVLDKATVDILKRMQNLRNMAVHERWNAFMNVTPDEAREFIALAGGIHEKISAVG